MSVARTVVELPMGDDQHAVLVTVRELTVAEVRAWVTESAASTFRDPVQAMVWDDLGLDELARMCDVGSSELEAFSPSELAPVLEAARSLNPAFFRLRAALQWAARRTVPEASPPP